MEFPALLSRTNTAPADHVETGGPLRAPRVPRRRRWWLLVLTVALVVTAGTSSYWLFAATDARVQMLIAAREIPFGTTITNADLTTALLATDGPARTVPASERHSILGQTAAATIPAGSFLNPAALRQQSVPGPGEILVGLRAEPGTLPARGVRGGEVVRVVPIDDAQSGVTDLAAGEVFDARVLGVGEPDAQGIVTVDVLVSANVGERASSAAAGRVVLVLVGPDQ